MKIKIKDARPKNYLFFYLPTDPLDFSKGGDIFTEEEEVIEPGVLRLSKAFSHRDFFMSLRALPEFEALARTGYTYMDIPRGRCDFVGNGMHSLEANANFLREMIDSVENQIRIRIDPEQLFGVSVNIYPDCDMRMVQAIQLYWQAKGKK